MPPLSPGRLLQLQRERRARREANRRCEALAERVLQVLPLLALLLPLLLLLLLFLPC